MAERRNGSRRRVIMVGIHCQPRKEPIIGAHLDTNTDTSPVTRHTILGIGAVTCCVTFVNLPTDRYSDGGVLICRRPSADSLTKILLASSPIRAIFCRRTRPFSNPPMISTVLFLEYLNTRCTDEKFRQIAKPDPQKSDLAIQYLCT